MSLLGAHVIFDFGSAPFDMPMYNKPDAFANIYRVLLLS